MACPKSLYQENLKLRSGETTCLATQNMVPGLAAASSPSIYLIILVALGLRCCTWYCSSCSESRLFFCCSTRASHCKWVLLLWSRGSRVPGLQQSQHVAHGLSCSLTCGFFLDPGLNPALAVGLLSTEPPRKTTQKFQKDRLSDLTDICYQSII